MTIIDPTQCTSNYRRNNNSFTPEGWTLLIRFWKPKILSMSKLHCMQKQQQETQFDTCRIHSVAFRGHLLCVEPFQLISFGTAMAN